MSELSTLPVCLPSTRRWSAQGIHAHHQQEASLQEGVTSDAIEIGVVVVHEALRDDTATIEIEIETETETMTIDDAIVQ